MYKKALYVLVFVFLLMPGAALASFKDIPETSPYYQPVKYLEDKEIIKSRENSIFNPEGKMKKIDFIKTILMESGVAVPEKGAFTGFKDVKKDAWYAPYVKKALDLGVIEKSDYLNPQAAIRRGEGLEMIFELKGIGIPKILDNNVTFKFKDIKKSSRYAPIAKAVEVENLLQSDTFMPYKTLARGEVAEILYKLGTKKDMENAFVPPTITIEIGDLSFINGITTHEKFPILVNVWETILDSYLRSDEISEDELIYAAISGMVEKLDDPYSIFQKPLAAEVMQVSLQGNYEGIGVMVEMIDEKFTVISPFPGTPAERAGMKPGDVVTHVNGESISGMLIEEIVSKIKGPAGTTVDLKIERDGMIIPVTVERAEITLEAVTGEIIEPSKIGLITITSFTQNSAEEFAETANDLIARGARGFVIDLRNNPGGFLDAVMNMLDNYVVEGSPILSAEHGDGTMETIFSDGPAGLADIKTAVLVNGGTASASEIFAGVLQDYGLAKIVGEKTFGKGTVQQLTQYGDGSALKLTIAKWLTAKERDINEVGIEPDFEIEDNEETENDEVLERGIIEVIN